MTKPTYDRANDKWYVKEGNLTVWFSSYDTAYDFYLMNKDK